MRWRLFLLKYRIRIMLVTAYILSLGYAYWIEPHFPWLSRWQVEPPGGVGESIRVVQLSDVHLRRFGDLEKRVVARLQEIKPDLIVLTGDMVFNDQSVEFLEQLLAELQPIAPVLGVRGNWEHYTNVTLARYRQVYEKYGARLLNNESVTLTLAERGVLVTGLDDSLAGEPNVPDALRGITPQDNHLVLIHSPDYYDLLPAFVDNVNRMRKDGLSFRPTFVLAGHTHGGQVTFFGYAIKTAPGSGDYVSGWYGEGWPRLYVSRGIGTSILPIRFFAPPEIVLFEWRLQ
ncbi:MAG: hypothetical protein G8345_14195 [Magnetococcales bacterium]|nr:metallophosphoesterase family protein [Magnetococcales bacterium]NGZ28028.1 hypothetical protein [Magnetococcales bacterium]